ncbi:hypothetical protein Q5P01_023763 [Channa striata]|uniref:Uncharacterized protein n=1 Tax=Channa striata TaxID=64152 RepID=A0AA88LKJ7_CHASR|nr:hypothetical protein Q5P01_023763 [Channa striata]
MQYLSEETSGRHRMEDFKFFRGGATLVISLDGLNWFSKRRCSNKGLKKRDEDLQLWTGQSSRRDRSEKRRKSVSFNDDVTLYLFDQECPTVELHSEPCTSSPNIHSCTLPDVTLDDNGLEWEDDFSALDENCHFQCIAHSQDNTFSLPTQRWTSLPRPERFSLPQTCLFLTHIAESDLELTSEAALNFRGLLKL